MAFDDDDEERRAARRAASDAGALVPLRGARCRAVVLVVGAALAAELNAPLRRDGHAVHGAADVASAWSAVCADLPDVLIVDLGVCRGGTARLLRRLRETGLPVIAVLAPRVGAWAADAVDAGAQLLARPVVPGALRALLGRAWAERRRQGELAYYRQRDAEQAGLTYLIGRSIPMLRVKARLQLLLDAETLTTGAATPPRALLLQGEAGTGRERVARALHFEGVRAASPFVSVDARDAGAPQLEGRLFGHEHGTRAAGAGLAEAADGGTLFVRHAADASPRVQARLARLVTCGTLRRDGSARDRPIDLRLVLATHGPAEVLQPALQQALADAPIVLPPLRERGDDLWPLAEHFLRRHARRDGRAAVPALGRSARAALAGYAWPGNLRELRHTLERAALLAAGATISRTHLGFAPRVAENPEPGLDLRGLERGALVRALQRSAGNVSRAARLLGISRDTMRYRMLRHGLAGQVPGWLPADDRR